MSISSFFLQDLENYKKSTENQREPSILDYLDAHNRKVIEVLKEKESDHLYLGEKVNFLSPKSSSIFVQLSVNPNILAVGQTRSGKTKAILSMIYSYAKAHKGTEWLFADGKGSTDYNPFADKLSAFPVAKPKGGDDISQFSTLIDHMWDTYKKRRQLFLDTCYEVKNCSTIADYRNLVGDMERIFLVVDELTPFIVSMNFNGKYKEEGTTAYKLYRLLSEGAPYGINFIFLTQRYEIMDVPTALKSKLSTQLFFNLSPSHAEKAGIKEAVNLKPGEFYVNPRLEGWSPRELVKLKMPYIGDAPSKLLDASFDKYPSDKKLSFKDDVEDKKAANESKNLLKVKQAYNEDAAYKILIEYLCEKAAQSCRHVYVSLSDKEVKRLRDDGFLVSPSENEVEYLVSGWADSNEDLKFIIEGASNKNDVNAIRMGKIKKMAGKGMLDINEELYISNRNSLLLGAEGSGKTTYLKEWIKEWTSKSKDHTAIVVDSKDYWKGFEEEALYKNDIKIVQSQLEIFEAAIEKSKLPESKILFVVDEPHNEVLEILSDSIGRQLKEREGRGFGEFVGAVKKFQEIYDKKSEGSVNKFIKKPMTYDIMAAFLDFIEDNGGMVVVASQSLKLVPKKLIESGYFKTKIIARLSEQDANKMDIPAARNLSLGEYIVYSEGLIEKKSGKKYFIVEM